MLGICFFVLCALSCVFAFLSGNMDALANAIPDGAGRAVTLTLSLGGMTALWSGITEVLQEGGVMERLSRVLSPVLRFVFPETWKGGVGREEITAALAANMLGMGNAATPLALCAMEKMQKHNPHPHEATDDMVTFAVLGSASFNLLPATLIALRRQAGCAAPYDIVVPVWIVSGVCSLAAVLLCRLGAATNLIKPKKTAGRKA